MKRCLFGKFSFSIYLFIHTVTSYSTHTDGYKRSKSLSRKNRKQTAPEGVRNTEKVTFFAVMIHVYDQPAYTQLRWPCKAQRGSHFRKERHLTEGRDVLKLNKLQDIGAYNDIAHK